MGDGPDAIEPSVPKEALRVELDGGERRVLGVLIEKNMTTPDYYPMTTKALVAGCNQKNNRDPVTAVTEDDVREALAALQGKKLVMAIKPEHGHATRWRHELDRRFGIQGRELAVLGELLLRGPQTEGELRSRASRMRNFDHIETLHETLARLASWVPPLVMRLSPEGAVRGVRHAHLLYPQHEMDAVRASEDGRAVELPASLGPSETSSLKMRVEQLEARLAHVEAFLARELGDSFTPTGGAPTGLDGGEAQ